MATAYWRCNGRTCSEDPAGRLGYDFFSEVPVCPKCGANSSIPEHKRTVVRLVPTHFLIEDKDGKIVGDGRKWRLACDPNVKAVPQPPVGQSTSEFSIITCRKCKESPEWLACVCENHVHLDYDLELDMKSGKYKLKEERKLDSSIAE